MLNRCNRPILLGRAPVHVTQASCGREPRSTFVARALAPAQPTDTAAAEATEAARPSNPGGPGPALNLIGDPRSGAQIFVNCVPCHGNQGKGGDPNPGSPGIVIFSGDAKMDDAAILNAVRPIRAGGRFGSFIGHNSFQRDQMPAWSLLDHIIRICKGETT